LALTTLAFAACATCPNPEPTGLRRTSKTSTELVAPATSATPPKPGALDAHQDASPSDSPEARRLRAIQARIDVLLEDCIAFWLRHGFDEATGGYHGKLDRFGEPDVNAPRGLVQQSRHLFSLSVYHRMKSDLSAERRAQLRVRADGLFRFITKSFYDPKDHEFFFRVDAKGKVLDRNKPLYGESFVVYALAEYAMAFGSESARQYALECFRSFDARSHDAKNQGYDQTGTSRWLYSGAAKDTNTHIHLLESTTHLYRATQDSMAYSRARELVEVVLHRLVQPRGYTHAEFAADFTPFGPAYVSYGHDIETAWLLLDAYATLEITAPEPREQAYALGMRAAEAGFDPTRGGFFEEGSVDGPATKLEKIWWVQAEAIAGMVMLHQHRATPTLLQKLEATLDWVERYQWDRNQGEWYWGVASDGRLGAHRDVKSEEWKSSYHVLRALLFSSQWLNEVLTRTPQGSPKPAMLPQ
jgi:mannobiose 2-epimerase